MGNEIKDRIPYKLALSVVKVSGTISSDFSPQTSQPRKSASSDIQVFVEADPRPEWAQRLSLKGAFARDTDFDLKLTPDGRLTSGSGTTTGAGGALIEAGVKVGVFLGSTMIALASKGASFAGAPIAKAHQPAGRTFDETLEAEKRPLYDLRETYRTSIVALQERIAAHGAKVAAAPEVGLDKLLEGSALRGTLERIRAEAAEVEAEVDAWRRSRFPSMTEDRAVEIAVDDLPLLDMAEPSHSFDLTALPVPVREAAEHLGVVVGEVRLQHTAATPTTTAPATPRTENGIWFRSTRPAGLAIYERPLDSDGDFTLRSVTPSTVIDSRSELNFVSFDSGVFEKRAGGLEFGDSGALSHLTRSSESAARQLSAALSAVPGEVKESVEQAGVVSTEIAKLRSAAATSRLADLTRRKETIDAEIAEKGALATRSQHEALATVNTQVELAEAEQKLLPAPPAAPSPNRAAEEQLARAKLDLELRQVEAEMARLVT